MLTGLLNGYILDTATCHSRTPDSTMLTRAPITKLPPSAGELSVCVKSLTQEFLFDLENLYAICCLKYVVFIDDGLSIFQSFKFVLHTCPEERTLLGTSKKK